MNDMIEKAISTKPRNIEEEMSCTLVRIYDLEKTIKELKYKIDILNKVVDCLNKESK